MGFFKNLFQIPIDQTYANMIQEYDEKIRNAETEEERERYTKELNDKIYLYSSWW